MRVVYDRQTDTLSIILNDGIVSESDEEKPGLILDYDVDGNIVSLEILDATQRVSQPTEMVYQLGGG
jgi:uncharacterized protein YuzE